MRPRALLPGRLPGELYCPSASAANSEHERGMRSLCSPTTGCVFIGGKAGPIREVGPRYVLDAPQGLLDSYLAVSQQPPSCSVTRRPQRLARMSYFAALPDSTAMLQTKVQVSCRCRVLGPWRRSVPTRHRVSAEEADGGEDMAENDAEPMAPWRHGTS